MSQKIKSQENKWLWDLRADLKHTVQEGVQPLEVYLQQFQIYGEILNTNPLEYAEKFNEEAAPRDISEIQSEIRRV